MGSGVCCNYHTDTRSSLGLEIIVKAHIGNPNNATILPLGVSCCSPSSRSHLCVQVLSSHLMHSSLPGLTRLEQMFLVALADTVATTSAEVPSSTDQQYTGQCICSGKWVIILCVIGTNNMRQSLE